MAVVSKSIKILVVDDFSAMRRIIKHLLGQLGYSNIIEAEDGASALHKAKAEGVDMIISDWNMPSMMGVELLQAVRSDPDLKNIPFLMVTPESQRQSIGTIVQKNRSNYIVKPFTSNVLEKKLEVVFDKQDAD